MKRGLSILSATAAISVLFCMGCSANAHKTTPEIVGEVVSNIYWSDGDSGRLDGVKFRLANVDAPETGSLKQRGGAKCESERAIGYEAKAYLVSLTKEASVKVERDYGYDRYDRLVVDLSIEGKDLGRLAIQAGHLAAWPHRNGRQLMPKPDWCK